MKNIKHIKYTVNSILRIPNNENRIFTLNFWSANIYQLDMLATRKLSASLQRSNTGSGIKLFDDYSRDYSYSVRGYKRANALITLFTKGMPGIQFSIYQSGKPLPSDFVQRNSHLSHWQKVWKANNWN